MRKPTLNVIKTDLNQMQVYFRAERKFGKTTLFRDLVLEKFGDPTFGCLIKVGHEDGDGLLDMLNSTDVQTYEEFLELVDWIIEQRGKEHNIQMIGVDVVDEIIPLVEAYIVRKARKEEGKPIKSILQVDGGYNRGPLKAAQELKAVFTKLKRNNIGVIAIAHTKTKTVKPKGAINEEEGYEVFTSALSATYEAVFGDIFDIILTGAVDRQIVDGKLLDNNRFLYFRSDGFIQAGGRMAFGTVPDRIPFDKQNMAKDIIAILEDAMRKSSLANKTQTDTKPVDKPVEPPKSTPTPQVTPPQQEPVEQSTMLDEIVDEVLDDVVDDDFVDVDENKKLLSKIQTKFKTATKESKGTVRQFLADNGYSKFEPDTMPTKFFKQAVEILG